jgi:hypothetical protein
MLRLMTSILTAFFVTSLTAGMVPGQDQDEPVAAKSKSSGSAKASDPVTTEACPAKKPACATWERLASLANPWFGGQGRRLQEGQGRTL